MGRAGRLVLVFAVLLLAGSALAPIQASAQEVYAFGGASRKDGESSLKFGAWGVSYMEGLTEHLVGSFTYLNEGHLDGHHRDGPAIQVWYRHYLAGRSLSLDGGAGPYLFYDTIRRSGRTTNTHGVAPVFSLAATWHFKDRWLVQLRGNYITSGHGIDTLSATLGAGMRLDASPGKALPASGRDSRGRPNELVLSGGQSADNSYEEGHSAAVGLEYRRRLLSCLEWTFGWLNETDSSFAGRYGPYTQLFGVRDFFDGRLSLGLGLGPYLARDTRDGRSTTLTAMAGITGVYQVVPAWSVRVSWQRITTHYHCDADVVLGGLGYRF